MHLYEDLSLEDALDVGHEAHNSLNLQLGEQRLENPLLLLVVRKALAYYKPQRYDPAHHN